MRLESLTIKNFRGIKDLSLEMGGENFVVDGPNGSGKSGVVEAIQFVFTGRIGRLEGPGTSGISLRNHAPHVDHRDALDEVFVEARVRLADGKFATIRRSVDKPNAPTITPATAELALRWLSTHPEIALSRRELIRLILIEAGERSKAIQTLLKLDDLEDTRKNLTTAANTLDKELKQAAQAVESAGEVVATAVGVAGMDQAPILAAVNGRRAVLGLSPLVGLTASTRLSEGIGQPPAGAAAIDKDGATREIEALGAAIREGAVGNERAMAVLASIAVLDARPELMLLLAQYELVSSGLVLADSPECPLCDEAWDLDRLRAHLHDKLARAEAARAFAAELVKTASAVAGDVQNLIDHLTTASSHARVLGLTDIVLALGEWSTQLRAFRDTLREPKGIIAARARLDAGWGQPPVVVTTAIAELREAIGRLHAPSEADAARTYLVRCDAAFTRYWEACDEQKDLADAVVRAKRTKELFEETSTAHLAKLYADIEQDLVRYYRRLNEEDELNFDAKLDPKKGKLTLDVDFFGRGLFPPGAYHSEGHQDGMGLCLYLALVKRLFGERFTFGVLDDVVMSVDKGHRKRVCNLLREEFGKTQFVITTHDDVWLHQMIAAGLVTKRGVKRFRGWRIDTGPLVYDYRDAWELIDEHLLKEEIPQAAALLRRYLEQVASELCERFGASTPHRRDVDHSLGELLPNATKKWGQLLEDARKAADSWRRDDVVVAITARQHAFKAAQAAANVEQWAVNKSVHYNPWADFSKADFAPVVRACRELLNTMRCEACSSWVVVTPPHGTPDAIICDCLAVRLTLRTKRSS